MAIYISIKKRDNVGSLVAYSFSLTDGREGLLHFDPKTGESVLVNAMGPSELEYGHFRRAAHRLKKAWQAGDVPDETCWAS